MDRFGAPKSSPSNEQGNEAMARRLALLLELTPVIIRDLENRIMYWNRAAEVMYGFTTEQATGQFSYQLLRTRLPEPLEHILARLRSGRQWQGELHRTRSDGREIVVASEWVAHLNDKGQLEAIVEINKEITDRKQMETELAKLQSALSAHTENLEQAVEQRTARLSQTIAELESFSATLAHDLRAPLRTINSFTHIVLDDYGPKLESEVREMLQRVLHAADHMEQLVQDVTALSRVTRQPLELKTVNLEPLLLEIIQGCPEFQPPAAEFQITRPLLPVISHESLLTQCLVHLFSNAVNFVAPGTKPLVRIWTEATAQSPEQATSPMDCAPSSPTTRHPSPSVRLWIADNGLGIPPEEHGKIFEAFQRYHSGYEGTGLGLAIVKKAVERMGGRVGVESAPGQGSRFWIELPPG